MTPLNTNIVWVFSQVRARQRLAKLTDIQIKNARPREKDYKLSDGDGLYLFVRRTGSKLWRINYRYAGKAQTYSLGRYPAVTLKRARDGCAELRSNLARGLDPAELKREAKKNVLRSARNTFECVAKQYISKKEKEHRASGTVSKYHWTLDAVGAVLRRTPIDKITGRDAADRATEIANSGHEDKARRTYSFMRNVLDHAFHAHLVDTNPLALKMSFLPKRPPRHHPGLTTPDDLGQLLVDVHGYSGEASTVHAIEFCCHTFLRPGELRLARWDEFNLKTKIWTVPAERMKKQRTHIVPLTDHTEALLERLRELPYTQDYVFASAKQPHGPISENTMNQALWRLGYKDRQTAHGFRTSASTILHENDFNSDWIEKQLAHVEMNTTKAAYNAAQYLAGRKEMMAWWSSQLESWRKKAAS